MVHKGLINLQFDKVGAISLLKRYGGAAFLDEESEEEAIKQFSENRIYSMHEIIGVIIIFGVKNFDHIDIKALAKGIDCSVEEIEEIIEKEQFDSILPIKLTQKEIDEGLNKLSKKLIEIKTVSDYSSKKKMIFLVKEAQKRFRDWMNQGRILIKNEK